MNEGDVLVPLYTDPTEPVSAVPWWTFSADLLVKLAFVLLLIYGSLWLLRRLTQNGPRRPGHMLVSIVEQTMLAPGRSVYLLELGNRMLLVGSTATQISTLAEISDPAEVAELQGLRHSEHESPSPFATQLRSLLDRSTWRQSTSSPAPGGESEGTLHSGIQAGSQDSGEISRRFGVR
jgi:flagellar biosynthetic protein FliO